MMNLFLRVVSAVVLIPILISVLILGGMPFFVLMCVVFSISMHEYAGIVLGQRHAFRSSIFVIAPLLFMFLTWAPSAIALFVFWGLICFFMGAYFVFKPELPRENFEKAGALLFGLLYISGGLVSIYCLRTGGSFLAKSATGLSFLALLLIVTWSNDTFAYFTGRIFGKNKLNEKVSEKKTWEGFFGGALFTLIMPFLLKALFASMGIVVLSALSVIDILFIALPTVLLAPLGDLVESRIKRFYGFKDSGNILPGHGGLLDRIDALLIVGPWVAAYAFLIRPLW